MLNHRQAPFHARSAPFTVRPLDPPDRDNLSPSEWTHSGMADVRGSTEQWGGLEECVVLSNGENVLFVDEETTREYDDTEWNVFSGHRLWHAPEDHERTYVPDNDPVDYELTDAGVHLVQPVEEETGIRKEISVELPEDEPRAIATHSLTNEGSWPVSLAPWGVTVFAGGGRCVVPFETGPESPTPNRSIALWSDASLADERLEFAEDHVLMDQSADGEPTKFGVSATDGWAAYVVDGTAFCKSFPLAGHDAYPDRGSAVELYTDPEIFELESLAGLTELEPGDTATHTETWQLFDGVDVPETDADVVAAPYPGDS